MAFSRDTLDFLRRLKRNNRKEWFDARKDEYVQTVRGPMLELAAELDRELAGFAPDYITEPERAVYRIYRDVRFSKDKTPYKTEVSALFYHQRLGKNAGPGFYVALSPEQFLIAAGLYLPGTKETLVVREHIASEHDRLRRILDSRPFRQRFEMMEEGRLSRPPKGFCSEHPAIELLKQKSWIVGRKDAPEGALARGFSKSLAKDFRLLAPFVSFLAEPLLKRAVKRDPLAVSW